MRDRDSLAGIAGRLRPPHDGGMDDISLGVLLPIGQAQWGGADPRELVDFAVRAEDLG